MTCKDCDSIMHMDSKGLCACISCGYTYDQANKRNLGGYSNKGLTAGKPPVHNTREEVGATSEDTVIPTNDAGETLTSVENTLKERGKRYGEFGNHAELAQRMKLLFHTHVQEHGRPADFEPFMIEAIDMVLHKLARIANGDPAYDDNYRDIAGFATLVVVELSKKDTYE